MFAILVFSGMMGFTGMLIGVPLFALIYSAISALVRRRLRKKDLPDETDAYRNLDHIDVDTRELVGIQEGRIMPESVKITRSPERGKK